MKLLTQDKLYAMITDYHLIVNAIKEMRAKWLLRQNRTIGYRGYTTSAGGVSDPIMAEAFRRSKAS